MNEEKGGDLYSIPLGDKSEVEFGSPTFDRLDAKGKICPDAFPWDSLSSFHKFYKKSIKVNTQVFTNFTHIPTAIQREKYALMPFH